MPSGAEGAEAAVPPATGFASSTVEERRDAPEGAEGGVAPVGGLVREADSFGFGSTDEGEPRSVSPSGERAPPAAPAAGASDRDETRLSTTRGPGAFLVLLFLVHRHRYTSSTRSPRRGQ